MMAQNPSTLGGELLLEAQSPCLLHQSSFPVAAQPRDSTLYQWKQKILHFL
jgi:hypothetical protein